MSLTPDNDKRAGPLHRGPARQSQHPAKDTEPVSRPMVAGSADMRAVGELLALSDERDQWTRRILAAESAAFLDGCREGWRLGLERGARIRQAEWPAFVAALPRPDFAEIELLRYGPGGRSRFGDPRPGDYTPSTRLEAAS